MNGNNNAAGGFKVFAILIGGIIVLFNVLLHNTGGISGFVLYFGGGLCALCLLNPVAGLYILGFFCFYLDFVKKLAVVYGAMNMTTVMEVLAIQMLALGLTVAGALIRLMLFERRFNRQHFAAITFTVLLTLALLALSAREGMVNAVQIAANNGAYAGVILVALAYFATPDKMLKYLDYLFYLGIPWAAYGIYQYFFGFAEFEWTYAKTGLSAVSSNQMFAYITPRPFGFASGEGGYGVLGQLAAYGVWRLFTSKDKKAIFLFGVTIILGGLILSLQRTILSFPILCLLGCLAFRSRVATLLFYSICIITFIVGVAFSDLLLVKVQEIDNSNSLQGSWTSRVMRLGTWSDRLVGWRRLTYASTYTLFGKRWQHDIGAGESHDMINSILNNGGVVGLVAIVGAAFMMLRKIHRRIWTMRDRHSQQMVLFLVSILAIVIGFAGIGGSNLGTVPHNLVNWSFAAALIIVLLYESQRELEESKPAIGTEELGSITPGQPAPAMAAAQMPVPERSRFRKSGVMRSV